MENYCKGGRPAEKPNGVVGSPEEYSQKLLPSLGWEGQRKEEPGCLSPLPVGTGATAGAVQWGQDLGEMGCLAGTKTMEATQPLPEYCQRQARKKTTTSPFRPPFNSVLAKPKGKRVGKRA